MDLNIDENETGYGQDEMVAKQKKFDNQIKNIQVNFTSKNVEIPVSNKSNINEG